MQLLEASPGALFWGIDYFLALAVFIGARRSPLRAAPRARPPGPCALLPTLLGRRRAGALVKEQRGVEPLLRFIRDPTIAPSEDDAPAPQPPVPTGAIATWTLPRR